MKKTNGDQTQKKKKRKWIVLEHTPKEKDLSLKYKERKRNAGKWGNKYSSIIIHYYQLIRVHIDLTYSISPDYGNRIEDILVGTKSEIPYPM